MGHWPHRDTLILGAIFKDLPIWGAHGLSSIGRVCPECFSHLEKRMASRSQGELAPL